MIRSLCIISLALMLGGCANYWSARGRDTADLMTLTATTGGGVKVQLGPVQLSPVAVLVDVGGLRGGEFFAADLGDDATVFPMDVGALWWSSSILAMPNVPRLEDRGKAYCAFPMGAEYEELFARHTGSVPFITVPRATWAEEKLELRRVSPAYLGQLEFALCLGVGLRVGTNVVEWADFACGWFGVDILDDDLSSGPRAGKRRHQPVLRIPDSDRAAE